MQNILVFCYVAVLQYSNIYSATSVSLWHYDKNKLNDDASENNIDNQKVIKDKATRK